MNISEECQALRDEGLSHREIAASLGISRGIVHHQLKGYDIDPAIGEAMEVAGTRMVPNLLWKKVKGPDGTRYSVQLKPEKTDTGLSLEDIKDAFRDIPRAPKISAPKYVAKDLLTVYPYFDVHLGLRAHAEFSGEEVDVASTKERLLSATAELVASAPPSHTAVIVNGGDFTHADDDENATPRGKHILDVACRNHTAIVEAVELISALIELALAKHKRVEYISVPGNHDPKNWTNIMVGLYYRYRGSPRVKIELTPIEFASYEFGQTLIAVHHGHKRKPQDLVAFFAAEYAQVWGRTKARYLFTGHYHSLEAKRYPGMYWERMEPVTPRDHYAASSLYDQASSLTCVTYSKQGGEKSRVRVGL